MNLLNRDEGLQVRIADGGAAQHYAHALERSA
jgi:hypothetical protein